MEMEKLSDTDLILNDNGSVYHLHLREEHIADHVILVGDQGRVSQVSKYFDKLEFQIQNREFLTHTGRLGQVRVTVVSTGIGTDNIDIAINELDAAVNIEPLSRQVKTEKRKLNLIRIGTCGALQPDIPVGSRVISEYGLGFDGLLHYYDYQYDDCERELALEISQYLNLHAALSVPYICKGSKTLINKLGEGMIAGITATASGFYAPQGRELRLQPKDPGIEAKLSAFRYKEYRILNFEMETSAIYGLGNLLGHDCCTCCAVIANRVRKEFSKDYQHETDALIRNVLEKLS